jgi:hypothetical protein
MARPATQRDENPAGTLAGFEEADQGVGCGRGRPPHGQVFDRVPQLGRCPSRTASVLQLRHRHFVLNRACNSFYRGFGHYCLLFKNFFSFSPVCIEIPGSSVRTECHASALGRRMLR